MTNFLSRNTKSDFNFTFDQTKRKIILNNGEEISLSDPKAFDLISNAWLQSGWDTKYVYSFTWLGRPIIQLPDDILRIQEVIYETKPDVIVETGVAHGGSLIFYATLLTAIGKGRAIGVDIDIRKHNRSEIEKHRLSGLVTLIEGSSISEETLNDVKANIGINEKVLIILDSNHSKEHVLNELNMYSSLVTKGSYIIACDGIMKSVEGAPRTQETWKWDNPLSAINEFLQINKNFEMVEPNWPFNEGLVQNRVTYWPNAFLKKK